MVEVVNAPLGPLQVGPDFYYSGFRCDLDTFNAWDFLVGDMFMEIPDPPIGFIAMGMCVYACVCVRVCACVVWVCLCVCVCACVCVCVCVCVCDCVCTGVCYCVCLCLCVCV